MAKHTLELPEPGTAINASYIPYLHFKMSCTNFEQDYFNPIAIKALHIARASCASRYILIDSPGKA